MLSIEEVKQNGWLIFEAIVGSKAYGLDTPQSDTDIRGVFVLPEQEFYGLHYTPQVSNETNDIVYYELRRFMELLLRNNPNILELLAIPEACLLYRHKIMDLLGSHQILSKRCEETFAKYAFSQIKKAYGLEKKIFNPVEEKRKSVLDFCFVYIDLVAVPLVDFLSNREIRQEDCGLTAVTHLRDCYHLFHSIKYSYNGILRKEDSNDIALSSIPISEKPIALIYFNKDAYSVYCKQYKSYWDWVSARNDIRYNNTLQHGKRYDAKNMMHVFRLLQMAKEIAVEGKINVVRPDRSFLLEIKTGKFDYDELMSKAIHLKDELPALFAASSLPDEPDEKLLNALLVTMRRNYYGQ